MPATDRFSPWLWRGANLVFWSIALAAIVAYTGGERFTATLVLTFAALIILVHAVFFLTGQVLDRIGRS